MPNTDRTPMTYQEWHAQNEDATFQDIFEAGRAAGIQEAAEHCDKEVEKIRSDPDLLASRDLKIMAMTYGNAADEIRALLPDREGK